MVSELGSTPVPWGHLEADRINRDGVLGTFCGGSDGNRAHRSGALVLLPARARQASDPGGEAPHDRYPTYDQDDPRGRGDGEGKYD
jgi:hypothetical protein